MRTRIWKQTEATKNIEDGGGGYFIAVHIVCGVI